MFRNFKVVQIAAASRNRVIGVQGRLPWHIPDDLKFFKEKTLNCVCIMGRKTFDSIGKKPLPRRLNIVVSRTPGIEVENLKFASTLEAALEIAADQVVAKAEDPIPWRSEIMIVGGGEIYRLALPWTDRVLLTEVDVELNGDATFPELPQEFKVVHSDRRSGEPAYTFVTYEKAP